MTDVLETIYAAIPGHADHAQRVQSLKGQRSARLTNNQSSHEQDKVIVASILQTARRMGDLEPIFDEMRAGDAKRASLEREVNLIDRAVKGAEHELEQFRKSHISDVVAAIGKQLKITSKHLASLGDIPANAEQAIGMDKVGAWKESQKLAADIDGLVSAYTRAARPFIEAGTAPGLTTGALIRDPAAVMPRLIEERRSSASVMARLGRHGQPLADWLGTVKDTPFKGEVRGSITPADADKVAWYAYLAAEDQFTARTPDEAVAVHTAALNAVKTPGATSSAILRGWDDIATYAGLIRDEETVLHAQNAMRDAQNKPRRNRAQSVVLLPN